MWFPLLLLSLAVRELLAFPAPDNVAGLLKPNISPAPNPCPKIKCPGTEISFWDFTVLKCVCPPVKPCAGWACIAEQEAVYDTVTRKCGCRWIPGLEPYPIDLPPVVKETASPPTKTSKRQKLFGEPIPTFAPREAVPTATTNSAPEPICLAKCSVGYHTVHFPDGGCTCKKNAEPLPCGIKCREGHILVTDLDTGKCKCEKDQNFAVCFPKCKEGSHWVDSTEEGPGRCVQNAYVWPCPIRCTSSSPLFINPETGKCSCMLEKDICLNHTHYIQGPPVWDNYTKTCSCSPEPEVVCKRLTTCATDLQPVWNEGSSKCACEPILNSPEFICLAATTCFPGFIPRWESETQVCRCVPA